MWACQSMASNAHQVNLICAKGSSAAAEKGGLVLPSNLRIIETIEPSWEGKEAAEAHYRCYRDIIEKECGDGDGIVWDNTWHCFSYLSAAKFLKMKIIHTHHGVAEWQRIPPHQINFPRYIGLSRLHAKYLSSLWKIPVRFVHHGIPLPPKEETRSDKSENYLLSLNRIIPEKGIEDSIDIARRTGTPIKIIGDDVHVRDYSYVQMIRERCHNTGGLAEYIGLVNNETKKLLIKNCKAVIACPKPSWIEAFGLYALEANAYGKPVLALANGGLNDIIVNETNGFLANTPEELQGYIDRIPECSAESCRKRVENFFTAEIMSKNYLEIFARVMEDDPLFRW
jgi:glycosyltransferase involved in cell wall biosynthesis